MIQVTTPTAFVIGSDLNLDIEVRKLSPEEFISLLKQDKEIVLSAHDVWTLSQISCFLDRNAIEHSTVAPSWRLALKPAADLVFCDVSRVAMLPVSIIHIHVREPQQA